MSKEYAMKVLNRDLSGMVAYINTFKLSQDQLKRITRLDALLSTKSIGLLDMADELEDIIKELNNEQNNLVQ